MKRFTFILTVAAIISVQSTIAQDSDSLKSKRTVRISPDMSETNVNAIGNYIRLDKDTLASKSNTNQSILNTLRGHVPNFASVTTSYPNSTGLRSGNSMMIIDGVPSAGAINYFNNLTSFEYHNIYAVSGAAATMFGGLASNGAIFLESKTGKDFHKPTFQFAFSPSFNWKEGGSAERIEQWQLTNAVSYQQDFGKIDTRLSYTFSHLPDDNNGSEFRSNFHSLKLNTGFDITPRFNIRLIIDENRSISKGEGYTGVFNEVILNKREMVSNLFQANMNMQYRVLDWLLLSSQTAVGAIDDDMENSVPEIGDVAENNLRLYTNLFISVARPIAGKLSFNAFAGSIYESQRAEQSSRGSYWSNEVATKFVTQSGAMGVGLNLDDFLFLNYQYRIDDFQDFASDDQKSTFTLTSSFVFTNAFGLESSWLSLGKLRGSYGDSFYVNGRTFPYTFPSQQASYYYNFQPTLKTNKEAGIDLGFINNRIVLQSTFFNDLSHHNYGYLPIPGGANGTIYQIVDIGAIRTKGVEFVLGTTPIQLDNVSMNTKLIYATLDTKIESPNNRTQGGGGLIMINTNPDWRGSLLNQLIWKKVFVTFLIDLRHGGDILEGGFAPNMPIRIVDGSYTQLRDLSLGYTFTQMRAFRQLNVAVSGRNLWTIYSNSAADGENQMLSQRGVTLNAVLTF